ncbi:uncharacterized protein [Nicotiana tomentosiformis]|uniref:uncharacterized protein n=1 Tax=Nicotiana tomentosiformis TaxID=4098 RepID=UPI00388C421D
MLKDPTPIQKEVVPEKGSGEQLKNKVDKKKKGKKGTEKNNVEENSRRGESEESKHMRALPFPQKIYREKLEISRHAETGDPYKEEEDRRNFSGQAHRALLHILQNKLPQECGDPGSFTIPCSLGTLSFDKSLCDSSASVNSMPLSIYRKLENEIREIRYAPIYLQLADQTTIIPEGIVEDFLVRVDKFVFPIDFIVVNMEENKEVPLILGRQFFLTGRAILDIHQRRLMLRVGEDTVTLEMNVETGAKKEKPAASA